jgi:hypothetical protein
MGPPTVTPKLKGISRSVAGIGDGADSEHAASEPILEPGSALPAIEYLPLSWPANS